MSALTKVSRFPTKTQLREVFAHLTRGDTATFYTNYVADNVSWTVMGSNTLSKHYPDKETFLSTSAARVAAVLDGPMKLHVRSVIGGEVEEWAVIEMASEAKCKNGEWDDTLSQIQCLFYYFSISLLFLFLCYFYFVYISPFFVSIFFSFFFTFAFFGCGYGV